MLIMKDNQRFFGVLHEDQVRIKQPLLLPLSARLPWCQCLHIAPLLFEQQLELRGVMKSRYKHYKNHDEPEATEDESNYTSIKHFVRKTETTRVDGAHHCTINSRVIDIELLPEQIFHPIHNTAIIVK